MGWARRSGGVLLLGEVPGQARDVEKLGRGSNHAPALSRGLDGLGEAVGWSALVERGPGSSPGRGVLAAR